MRASSFRRTLGLLVALAVGSACSSGGGGGGTTVDPNAPVISNLRVSFGAACAFPTKESGTVEITTFDYVDADGDVRGGTVEVTAAFGNGGAPTLNDPIPSRDVTITGTTSGTLIVTACLRFGSNPTYREQVKITDASGKSSNTLTLHVPNSGGLPLAPRGADPTGHRSPNPR